MNEEESANDWVEKASNLRTKFSNLRQIESSLPEAVRMDFHPKLERAETMLSALERDAAELSESTGPGAETVQQLAETVDFALRDLQHELNFLTAGNPTTVSAAADATAELVERAKDKWKTITSKVSLSSRS